MSTADPRNRKPVTVLGTVMAIGRDGNWFTHRVEATGPDGSRMTFEVVSKQRHTGSVAVRWDPTGVAEARFVGTRPWGMYALAGLIVIIVIAAAWFFLT